MGGIEAAGLDTLRATLHAAGDAIADQTKPNQAVADFIVAQSRPQLPKRTGALAASMTGHGTPTAAQIRVGARYAVPVLYGAPRAGTPAAKSNPALVVHQTQGTWLGTYDDYATDVCATVKGA